MNGGACEGSRVLSAGDVVRLALKVREAEAAKDFVPVAVHFEATPHSFPDTDPNRDPRLGG